MSNEATDTTQEILTTFKGRERPEDQMWKAGKGYEIKGKDLKWEKSVSYKDCVLRRDREEKQRGGRNV